MFCCKNVKKNIEYSSKIYTFVFTKSLGYSSRVAKSSLPPSHLSFKGLYLDIVWQNIVSSIGEVEVAEGNSLTEQIKADEERSKILRQIETLERQMRSSSQTRRQREIYTEIKKLKSLL